MSGAARRARGFTLLELVVVITIASVVAVFMVLFLGTPVEAYFAQSRRADLVDSADRVVRNLASDVQSALPNSLRQTGGGGVVALEMLATAGVARYYGTGDKSYLPPAQEAQEELATGQPDTDFYTLDQFASANGNYLAVDNQGVPGAYGFGGIMTPLPPAFTVTPNAATAEEQIHFAGAGFDFTTPSPTHSVFLVTGPVSYLCDINTQTVRRYWNYAITAAQGAVATDAQLMAAGATRSLLAEHVTACAVTVVPAPPSGNFGQLVVLNVTLSNAGETLPVFQEVATEYLP
jgi:MSHA biogenesis protein MshO